MIYITGDCHADFRRFTKKERVRAGLDFREDDYVIVCGDLGLLWAHNKEYEYNLKWLGGLPFKLLWVQGNHENYNMIKEYQLEEWNGGKVRHIVRDKIILLERGQVFNIDDKTFFTFGGASSHDIEGGILDRNEPDFKKKKQLAEMYGAPYRILNEEWWTEELPDSSELQEAEDNLEKCGYKVDYVISHCASNSVQYKLEEYYKNVYGQNKFIKQDILTDYFEDLEKKLDYKHWYCGHYHEDIELDDKHTILYYRFIRL